MVQYLIKPRSKAAEKKYLAQIELAALKSQVFSELNISLEERQKMHERIRELEKIAK